MDSFACQQQVHHYFALAEALFYKDGIDVSKKKIPQDKKEVLY